MENRSLKIGRNWNSAFNVLQIREVNITWDNYIIGSIKHMNGTSYGMCKYGQGIFCLKNREDLICGYIMLQNFGLKEFFDPFKQSLDFIQKKMPFYVDPSFIDDCESSEIKHLASPVNRYKLSFSHTIVSNKVVPTGTKPVFDLKNIDRNKLTQLASLISQKQNNKSIFSPCFQVK